MTSMTVNGEPIRYRLDPDTPLLWALRDASNLTGAKYGCDSGDCGACTVHIDGRAVRSCTVGIGSLEGASVVTIEGLSARGDHPLQRAWADAQVTQCGVCDSGFIMALSALLLTNPRPSPDDLAALPNLCRCGAGPRILEAVAMTGAGPIADAPKPSPAPPQNEASTPNDGQRNVQPPLR
jgi:isoquinoline 1-oxidoreductase alpha subunit